MLAPAPVLALEPVIAAAPARSSLAQARKGERRFLAGPYARARLWLWPQRVTFGAVVLSEYQPPGPELQPHLWYSNLPRRAPLIPWEEEPEQ